mmetsp:Transcript_33416/g.59799  ORF Transcript_33416/g.59799 Transcript_33416/m.59799 type:complete len:89 (+) Transcript_33416:191-457(+)|eukprot:CAMPEP_0177762290 /NCGR_PEP_ID=MMETSP0491_2-20121128/6266_1 /TAXON_ID=63592 /ORGANISM="Tetraselmis chuii, Strain PLY429" /LENGTH=88 /DNA_ID=CAMNT_0019278335 /DNA_START=189 /DNA_END=455 /DNA_ORIENTATION=-
MGSDNIKAKVLFFARSREIAGCPEVTAELPAGSTIAALRAWLLERYPELASIQESTVFALNHEYLEQGSDVGLSDGDEVALIPPISGG